MSKSVMLRTSNEDIRLNIDNYPEAHPNNSLTNLPEGWCYAWLTNNCDIKKKFAVGNGACLTNTAGTAFQIFIADDRNKTLVRRCASGITDLNTATWTLQT